MLGLELVELNLQFLIYREEVFYLYLDIYMFFGMFYAIVEQGSQQL
jgi:hypothetical protein